MHEDIYLVVRVEKCLDGMSLHTSMQPYLNAINDASTKVKTAIKLNKKMQMLENSQEKFLSDLKEEINLREKLDRKIVLMNESFNNK